MSPERNQTDSPGDVAQTSQGPTSRLRSLARPVTFLLLWGAAIWGVSHLQQAIGPLQASVCGPWGCTAPVEALIAYHGVWAVVLAGPAVALALYSPLGVAERWARRLLWAGLAASGALIAWGGAEWLLRVEPELRQYTLQRGLFVIVDQVDVPAIGVTLAGAAALLAVRCRRVRRAGRCGPACIPLPP